MGYYENPPIIPPSRGSEIISASIVDAASSLSKGFMALGERRAKEAKENKLTLQKLKDDKNETDLLYNEKLSNWAKDQTHITDEFDKNLYEITRQKIVKAADSRIMLSQETDPEKRQEYLKNIRDAEGFITSTSSFAKNIGGQVATNRLRLKAEQLGEPNGFVVNGSSDKEILDNTAVLDVLGGMTGKYSDVGIQVSPDDQGDGALLNVFGKRQDGTDFNVTINSKAFERSDVDTDDGLLMPVENANSWYTKAGEGVTDEKGNILPGLLSETRYTYDLDSKGTSGGIGRDIYQIKNGRQVEIEAIKRDINKKAIITATGRLSTDNPSRLRNFLNYTLKQGVGYYDDTFKNLPQDQQTKVLADILSKKAVERLTENLERTTIKDKDGNVENVIYWNPTGADIQIKDKPTPKKSSGGGGSGGSGTPPATTYRSEYYDKIIRGYVPPAGKKIDPGKQNFYTRAELVENLNKLEGVTSEFITREDLFKEYAASPYTTPDGHPTGKSLWKAFNDGDLKDDPRKTFAKIWGKKTVNGQVYSKKGEGPYREIKGYDLTKARDRILIALDQTVDAGERKILQDKLYDATVADWFDANPRRRGESDQAYAARARKSIKQ
jgi:hypothetical protein